MLLNVLGQPLGAAGTLAIAHGRHQLVVRRDGFYEVAREVQVPLGKELAIDVRLEPTPEHRAQLQRTVDQRRFLGITGVAVAAATLGAGIAAVAVNRGPYIAAVREYDSALEAYRDHLRSGEYVIRTVTLKDPPAQSWPLILKRLYELPANHHLVSEWHPLSPEAARKIITRARRHHHTQKTSVVET